MYNRRLEELKLSYYYDRLVKMPHGSFVNVKGRRAVTVVFCPDDPRVTHKHKRRYYVDSVNGRKWSEKISEYIATKSEFDRLLNNWRLNYRGAPDLNSYSQEVNKGEKLSPALWEKLKVESNPMTRDSDIVFQGQHFRSKNELAACQLIDRMGYEFKTEVAIRIS